MEVVPLGSAGEIAALAADVIEAVVRRKRAAVLGLATGSTPLPVYQELIRRHNAAAGPAYDGVTCFNLDEYVGLPAGHEQSYRATIARELTDGLGISPAQVNGPDPSPAELPTAGERYEALIKAAGGVDVQLLGVGSDGHLAFRARVIAGQPHPDQDPHRADTQGQRPLLRLPRRGADPCADPGARDHPRGAAPAANRHRRRQGRRGRGGGGGAGVSVLPGIGAAVAPARHGTAGPGRGISPRPP